MTPHLVEVTFWFSLGMVIGIYYGFLIAFKLIKFNPGPPMRIMEEHGVSRYNKEG